jgi:hypothetical protein
VGVRDEACVLREAWWNTRASARRRRPTPRLYFLLNCKGNNTMNSVEDNVNENP